MSKQTKPPAKGAPSGDRAAAGFGTPSSAASAARAPRKRPLLLALSIALFVLWLAFLIKTALLG